MLQMPWNQFVDRQHFDTVPDPQTLNGANQDPCETNIPDLDPTVLYTVLYSIKLIEILHQNHARNVK